MHASPPQPLLRLLLLLSSAALTVVDAAALPGPTVVPARVQARDPVITPAVRHRGRDIVSDVAGLASKIENGADSVLHSLGSVLGTDLPSYVISGIPAYFENLPTGTQVLESLQMNGGDLDAKPTQVLNIPPYANWTDKGWNVRFHGNVYKLPDIDQDKVDDLANVFLIDTSVSDLDDAGKAQARNLTRSIFVVQQGYQNVSFNLAPAPLQGADGEPGGGNSITPAGGYENITFPYETTAEGDFDAFVTIKNFTNGTLLAGNETNNVQRINVWTNGTDSGNATAFLVPTEGITFISDIDDILRVTKIYEPKEGLLNSFARPFTQWMNMPDIYANWSKTLPNSTHFHYLTTTPEQATRNYMDFIYKTYPGGSFDTRPLNFSDVNSTISPREYLLTKIFETFPKRKFVLVADTSNSDVMKDYPKMATVFPGQVACIFLRNTSSTDPGDKFPYNTEGFKDVNNQTYMFFHVPDDLMGLDIANGQCVNSTIQQNVTFALQDEVLGIHGGTEGMRGRANAWGSLLIAGMVGLLLSL